MKKLFLSSQKAMLVVVILASIVTISASSFPINEALAKPHASFVLVPDDEDPRQEHANPIILVLGHTNEPAFGKLPGIHDGKHYVEIILEDNATLLPVQGTNETSEPELELENTQIFIDKFYFKDIESFNNADSPYEADYVEENVPMSAVFGQPGLFYNRQIVDEGIYGYTIRGVINYYGVANVPIPELTKFCSVRGEGQDDTSKFDSEGWTGSYGCVENIKDIFFPPANKKPDGYPPNYDNGYGNSYNNNDGYENPTEQYQTYDNNNNNNEYVDDEEEQSQPYDKQNREY